MVIDHIDVGQFPTVGTYSVYLFITANSIEPCLFTSYYVDQILFIHNCSRIQFMAVNNYV